MRTSGTKRARPIRCATSPSTRDTAPVPLITPPQTGGTRLVSPPGPAGPGPGPALRCTTDVPDQTTPDRLHRPRPGLPSPGGGSAPCHPDTARSHPDAGPGPLSRPGSAPQLIGGRRGPGSPSGTSHGAKTRSTAANRPSAVPVSHRSRPRAVPVIRRDQAAAGPRLARGVAVTLVATGFSSCCFAAHSDSASC